MARLALLIPILALLYGCSSLTGQEPLPIGLTPSQDAANTFPPIAKPTETPSPTAFPTETPSPTPPPTETPVPTEAVPNVTLGLAKTFEEVKDVGSMEKLIEAAKYFAAQPPVIASDQIAQMGPMEYPDVSEVQIGCNTRGFKNCAILASARIEDLLYIFLQVGTKAGPKNLLLRIASAHTGEDAPIAKVQQEMLNSYTNGFKLSVVTRVKIADYENPEILELTVGPNDSLPESSRLLMEEGEITPELGIVWGFFW